MSDWEPKTKFENTGPCPRCNGAGSIRGFSHVRSGVCFRCHGLGTTWTKRGKAARTYWEQSLTVPADDVEVGDRVLVPGVDCIGRPAMWYVVESISGARGTAGTLDEAVPLLVFEMTHPKSGDTYRGSHIPDSPIRVAWTKEQRAAKLAAALEYESTLTKAGTPRKRKATA